MRKFAVTFIVLSGLCALRQVASGPVDTPNPEALRRAAADLSSDNQWRAITAGETLKAAGEPGWLLLLEILERGAQKPAVHAAEALAQAGDSRAVAPILRRLDGGANAPLEDALLSLLMTPAYASADDPIPFYRGIRYLSVKLQADMPPDRRQALLDTLAALAPPQKPKQRAASDRYVSQEHPTLDAALILETQRAFAAQDWPLVAALTGFTLDHPEDDRSVEGVATRIDRLRKTPLPLRSIYRMYGAQFQHVAADGSADAMRRMLDLGEALLKMPLDDYQALDIRILLLDGSIHVRNFDRALEILNAGIATQSEDWHAAATSKVRAMRAVEQKKYAEAAQHYRDVMVYMPRLGDRVPDPTTGLMLSSRILLARTAKRIGDLLDNLDDKAAVTKAYEQAAEHYRKALQSLQPATDVYNLVQSEFDQLPLKGK